jgi:hypothetical protein
MKHTNNSWNELFYYLYLLHIITTILHTLLPMMDKFLKAVIKELHTLFLHSGPNSPSRLFIWVIQMSTEVFLHFWDKVEVSVKSALYGSCGKMVRCNFSIVSMVVREVQA